MTPEQQQAIAPYFNPDRHGLFPGMPMDLYRSIPAFNPSLCKLGANEIKNSGARGHVTRILDRIENEWRAANGQPSLPGRGDNGSRSKDLGSIYHQLLLEPDTFAERYVVLTPEIREGLLAAARSRKAAEVGPLNSRMKEWREFKKEHGRDPDEGEQAAMQQARAAEAAEDCTWHSRLTEYVEWLDRQNKEGRQVVTEDEVGIAQAMADAIYSHPANRQVSDFLNAQKPMGANRVEVSMFAKMEWQHGGAVALKGRPDIIARANCFLDPKSCQSTHPYDFAKAVDQFGYAIQAGAYTLMSELLSTDPLAKEFGFPKADFGFIAQETTAPFLAKLWWLPPQWIKYGRIRFLTLIREFQTATEHGDWAGGGDEFIFHSKADLDFPGETLEPPQYLMPILEQF